MGFGSKDDSGLEGGWGMYGDDQGIRVFDALDEACSGISCESSCDVSSYSLPLLLHLMLATSRLKILPAPSPIIGTLPESFCFYACM
jgi:hypothetical protein